MPAKFVVILIIFVICLTVFLIVIVFPILNFHIGRTVCLIAGKIIITTGESIFSLGGVSLGITEMGITSFCNLLPI